MTGRSRAQAAYALAGAASFFVVWGLASVTLFEPFLLPPPWAVAARMVELVTSGQVLPNFAASLWRTVLGWGLAIVIGVPVGLVMGRYRYGRAFFHDLVYLAANVPLIVYAIIAIIVFGISGLGPTSVVILFVLPGIAINVAAGVQSVDPDLVAMSRAFGRDGRQVLRHVVLPTVVPFAVAAGRVSFADSWKLEALVETFGGSVGVGYQISRAYSLFSVEDLLAWMMFFVLFVLAVERLVLVRLERRLFAWRSPVDAGRRSRGARRPSRTDRVIDLVAAEARARDEALAPPAEAAAPQVGAR